MRISYLISLIAISCISFSHAIIVQLPHTQWQVDVAVTGPTQVQGGESTLFATIQLVNSYLWFAIGVVCMWVLIFGGYKLISSQGDDKKMSEANKLLMWALFGIVISLLSYALIRLVVNLF